MAAVHWTQLNITVINTSCYSRMTARLISVRGLDAEPEVSSRQTPVLKTNTPGALEGMCGIGPPASCAMHLAVLLHWSSWEPPSPAPRGGGGPLRDFRIHDLNGPQAGVGEEGFRVFFSLKIF